MFLALLQCLLGSLGVAIAAPIEIEALGGDRLEANPGETLTLGFRLSSSEFVRADEVVDLPEGWSLVTPGETVLLDPEQPQIRMFGVRVPDAAVAGAYSVVLGAASGLDLASRSVTVDVRRIASLELDMLGSPQFAPAGDSFEAAFRLVNRGNAVDRVHVSCKSDGSYRVRVEPAVVEVGAGQSAFVKVSGQRLASVAADPVERFQLEVVGTGARGGSVPFSVAAPTPFDSRTPSRDAHVEAQLAATLSNGAVAGRLGGAVEVALGPKDASKLRVVGGAGAGASSLGANTINFFRAELELRDWAQITLGDGMYGNYQLGGFGRYGRGVSTSLDLGPFELDAQVGRGVQGAEWTAADTRAALRFGERGRIGMAVSGLTGAGAAGGLALEGFAQWLPSANHRWSLRVGANPGPALELDRFAGLLEGSGRTKSTSYNLRWLRAGPEFRSMIRDVEQAGASLDQRLGDRLSLYANGARIAGNLNRAPDLASALRWVSAAAGARVNWGQGQAVWLGGTGGDSRDALGVLEHTTDLGAEAGWSGGWRVVQARVGGVVARRLVNSEPGGWVAGAEGSVQWKVSQRAVLGFAGRQSNADQASGIIRNTGGNVTISAQYEPVSFLTTSLDIGATPDFSTTNVQARLGWQPERGPRVSALGAYTIGSGRKGWTSQAFVSIPFDVPIAPDRRVASLRGRVYDGAAGREVGVPGVLVCLGPYSTLTDPDGRYVFVGVLPGTVQVSADPGSQSERFDVAEVQAILRGGKMNEVDIPLPSHARVFGRVEQTVLSPGNSLSEDAELTVQRGVAGIPVELDHGGQRYTRVTDADGYFAFEGLKPGPFKVFVDPRKLPVQLRLLGGAYKGELTAAESEGVNIGVQQTALHARIVDAGDLGTISASELGAAVSELVAGRAGLLLEPPSVVLGLAESFPMKVWSVRPDGRRRDVSTAVGLVPADAAVVEVRGREIVGRQIGVTEVHAEVGTMKSTARRVEVVRASVEGVVADLDEVEISVGAALPMLVGALLADEQVVQVTDRVAWSSSKPRVAEVVNGVLVAREEGSTILRATWGQIKGEPVRVVVVPARDEKVEADGASGGVLEIFVGDVVPAKVSFTGRDWSERTTWRASGGSAKVSPEGVISGVKPGLAIVRAITPEGEVVPLTVRVSNPPPVTDPPVSAPP